MRWLFVIGLSLELAGAVLLAWSVYARSRVENRQEALSVLGSNVWVIIFRERDQAYVRAGLGVLAAGFIVQLAGYLTAFPWPSWALALLVAVATGGCAFWIARRFASRAVPLELVRHDTAHVIKDERHGYGVATLEDVQALRRFVADRLYGRKLHHGSHVVSPRISAGTWVFSCPDCGSNHWSVATPELPTAVCSSCSGEFPARFPGHRAEIEQLLLARPDPDKRNWQPGETPDLLRGQNRASAADAAPSSPAP
jgi:hypothetical protein